MGVYVYRNGKVVPKDIVGPKRSSRSAHVLSDIQPFISPIDRTEITSRSHLREHERVHGVRQVGNDFQPPRKDS